MRKAKEKTNGVIGWRLASDPPKGGDWVIICNTKLKWVTRGVYAGTLWYYDTLRKADVTHWQPFPALPKASNL